MMGAVVRCLMIILCAAFINAELQAIELIDNGHFDPGRVKKTKSWIARYVFGSFASRKANKNEAVISAAELRFGPLIRKSIESVVVSQHIDVAETVYKHCQQLNVTECEMWKSRPMLFQVQAKGNESANLDIAIDILYDDGSLFLVTSHANSTVDAESGFYTTRFVISPHSATNRLMVHLILQKSTTDCIMVDNLSLMLTHKMPANVPVYNFTSPSNRAVFPYFSSGRANSTARSGHITIATQMTMDRMETLKRSAQMWQGPMSVAVLLLRENGPYHVQMKTLTEAYRSSSELYKFVNFHIVLEDAVNGVDASMYPANFLRNVALSLVTTDYVYLLDVDCIPGFTHDRALHWIRLESVQFKSSKDPECLKCAFVTPLFNVVKDITALPSNKSYLLDILHNSTSGVIPCRNKSQKDVNYERWYVTSSSYGIDPSSGVEPYFIVRSHAPLCNELYLGYGRDHISYVMNVRATGYGFVVLKEGFLLNIKNGILTSNKNTMHARSRGVQIRMHLTAMFHNLDIQNRVFTYPAAFLTRVNITKKMTKVNLESVTITNYNTSERESHKPKARGPGDIQVEETNTSKCELIGTSTSSGVRVSTAISGGSVRVSYVTPTHHLSLWFTLLCVVAVVAYKKRLRLKHCLVLRKLCTL